MLQNNNRLLPLALSGKKVFLHNVNTSVALRYGLDVVATPEKAEIAILQEQKLAHPLESLQPVLKSEEIVALQSAVKEVTLSEVLTGYIVDLVRYTRERGRGVTGVSPRGGLALRRAAQAKAFLHSRSYVTPEDIQELAPATLAHRIYSVTDADGRLGQSLVVEALKEVKVPV